MSSNFNSKVVTQGVQRSPNRAMLRAVGFGDGDFDKPIVGIANAYSTVTPCNAGLDILATRAEQATRAAGAMPQEPTPGQALRSTASSSFASIRCAMNSPTASKLLTMVKSRPLWCPGLMVPP